MSFVFADSPRGGGDEGSSGEPGHRSWLLHTAKHKTVTSSFTRTADSDRLLEAVASEANLARALLSVVRNKGAPGIDGQTVEEAEAQAPRLLADLRRELLAECFYPGDIRRVWIPKPGGGQRGLGIPNVRTRVVQQAVLQILEPIFEPTFHPSSHGFRRNRGAHTAIAEATEYLEEGFRTVVDLDLAQFFDRVHHQRLLDRMSQRVADRRILSRWDGLSRFLDDGRVDLDSNTVKRSIRPIALNRKNALFAGSDEGGDNWAVIATLIENCKLSGINPHDWLARTLTKLANGHPVNDVGSLMPWTAVV